jgi:hypothetical protein
MGCDYVPLVFLCIVSRTCVEFFLRSESESGRSPASEYTGIEAEGYKNGNTVDAL